jgi:hypothetical protein
VPAGRSAVTWYAGVPFYNRQFAKSGFAAEPKATIDAANRGGRAPLTVQTNRPEHFLVLLRFLGINPATSPLISGLSKPALSHELTPIGLPRLTEPHNDAQQCKCGHSQMVICFGTPIRAGLFRAIKGRSSPGRLPGVSG